MKPIDPISQSFPGMTQEERKLPFLNPDVFAIDGRDLGDYLSFVLKFSKALTYFNPQNQPEGNWQQLLLSDGALLPAQVMKWDLNQEVSKFLDYYKGILAKNEPQTKYLFIQQFFSIGFYLVLKINDWYRQGKNSINPNPFSDYLYERIEAEGGRLLANYYLFYFELCELVDGFDNEILLKLEQLDLAWHFDPFPCVKEDELTAEELPQQLDQALEAGQNLFAFAGQVVKAAGQYFQDFLQRNDIPPHIGLLLSFFELLKYPQQDLNRQGKAHLDFYYRSVLGLKPSGPLADHTYVAFDLAKNVGTYQLPEDTLLGAGRDETGKAVVFGCSEALLLTSAKVKAYSFLNFKEGKNEDGQDTLEGIFAGQFKKFGETGLPSWGLFGLEEGIDPNRKDLGAQKLGFAFASSDLILGGGMRCIKLQFGLNPGNVVFAKLTYSLFEIELTTAKGWLSVKSGSVAFELSDQALRISIYLQPTDPPILSYNPKVHGPGFEGEWPICRASLCPKVLLNDYKKLQSIQFKDLKVSTRVRSNTSLILQTNRGKASPTVPFQPFGAAPLPGTSLYFGGQEFFVKPLKALRVSMEWESLPDDFGIYYEEYPQDFQNDTFKASFSTSNEDGQWTPMPPKEQKTNLFSLFVKNLKATGSEEGYMPNPRRLEFEPGADSFHWDRNMPAVKAYSKENARAFFRLNFEAPDEGFGQEEYPKTLASISMENGQRIIYNSKNCAEDDKKMIPFLEAVANALESLEELARDLKVQQDRLRNGEIVLGEAEKELCDLLDNWEEATVCKDPVSLLLEELEKALNNYIGDIVEDSISIMGKAVKVYEDLWKKFPKEMSEKTKGRKNGDGAASVWSKIKDKILGGLGKAAGKVLGLGDSAEAVIEKIGKVLTDRIGHFLKDHEDKGSGLFRIFSRKKKNNLAQDELPPVEQELKKHLQKLIEEEKAFLRSILDTFDSSQTGGEHGKKASVSAEIIQQLKATKVAPGILEDACEEFKKAAAQSRKDIKKQMDKNRVWEFVLDLLAQLITELDLKDLVPEGSVSVSACLPLLPLPNKPFIPKVKSLELDYYSENQLSVLDAAEPTFLFYHLEPFGQGMAPADGGKYSLIPSYQGRDYIYLGLEKQAENIPLSLLFSISSFPTQEEQPGTLHFEYFSTDGWTELTPLADQTLGLSQTGVVKFSEINGWETQSGEMPQNLSWIRAWISDGDTASIKGNFVATNGIKAVRDLNYPTDLKPIKAATIKAPLNPLPAIANISQPLPSAGGQQAEDDQRFNQRVAYRLRHKQRASTPADIENLAMQRFDFIYSARAVPMGYYPGEESSLVNLILYPYTKLTSQYPYRPALTGDLQTEVGDYLKPLCPPSFELNIINPEYLKWGLVAEVEFNMPGAEGLLRNQLNKDLNCYLSPWITDSPFFGLREDRYDPNNVFAFVSSRPYVSLVNSWNFAPAYTEEQEKNPPKEALLLNVPVVQHRINKKEGSTSATKSGKPPVSTPNNSSRTSA